MKQGLRSIFMLCTLFSGVAHAQSRQVSGKVTSKESGEPLSGVSISIVGTSSATQSDAAGNYSLQVSGNNTLVFTYLGYLTQRVQTGTQTNISVALSTEETSLDEVIVTGYGTQRKREVTGSISSIKGEEFANATVPSLDKSLQGLASGVQASTTSGVLGQPAKIRIRGTSSMSSSSEPLYVVDGVPFISGD